MDFQDYLVPGKTGLLIGIGGVSMSPLAEVLHDAGLDIRGSDMNESDNTLTLRERGIPIHIGHSAANVTDDIEFVIRTAAVHDDNPEVHEAHRRGIPVFERTQAWGALMRGYPNALCISGTHGKTTTTSMIAEVLLDTGQKNHTVRGDISVNDLYIALVGIPMQYLASRYRFDFDSRPCDTQELIRKITRVSLSAIR